MSTLAQIQSLNDVLDVLGLDAGELTRVGLRIVLIWALAWLGLRVVRLVSKRIMARVEAHEAHVLTLRERRGQTLAELVRGVGRVLIVFLAVLLSLNIFIDIGPLLAGAGVAGLAISFGAQSLVKDVIAGFFIIFENQFAVGEIVEVAGKSGVVERMTLREVVIRDIEGVLHTIPNGEITMVSNKTRGWARAIIEVGIGYDVEIDRALVVFRDEAERFGKDPAWSRRLDGAPEVWGVESFADSAVIIRTVLRTQPGEQWDVGREYRRRIKNRLDQEGLEIPFPQRTLHVRYHDAPAEAGREPV